MNSPLKLYQDLLYQLDRYGSPSFEVDDFNYWWNYSIRKYVNRALEVYDLTQKVSDGLAPLISLPQTVSLNATDLTSVKEFALPVDYYRILGCFVIFRITTNYQQYRKPDKHKKKAFRMTADLRGYAEDNTYHMPRFDKPYYQRRGDSIYIEYETMTYPVSFAVIESVVYEYIKAPVVLTLNSNFTWVGSPAGLSQFPVEIDDEIMGICVKTILENIGDVQRLQSNIALSRN